jgi:signal transduction histidine kinase
MNDGRIPFGVQSGEELERFAETAAAQLADMEFYLDQGQEELPAEVVPSLRRHGEQLAAAAKTAGLVPVVRLLEALAAYLDRRGGEDGNEGALALLLSALRNLQAALRSLRLGLDGEALPPAVEDFSLRCFCHLEQRFGWPGAEGNGAPPLQILLADDDEIILSYLRDVLSVEHEVCSVNNGEDALAALRTGFFDLAFLDIRMPRRDGLETLEACSALRQEAGPSFEVVMMTGYASVESAARAVRLGAYDYLAKPFDGGQQIRQTAYRAGQQLAVRRRNRRLLRHLARRNRELERYTERLHEALSAVEASRQGLARAERLATLGALSAGVAHEINSPITFIRGNIETFKRFWATMQPAVQAHLRAEEDPRLRYAVEQTPGLMSDMEQGTERITRIVQALAAYCHREEAVRPHAELDLRECLRKARELVSVRLASSVELQAVVPEQAVPVRGDRGRLTEALVALLLNSLEALETQGGGRLEIGLVATERSAEVRVTDNGPGVPPELHERVFAPFFTTKKTPQASGLGLSSAQGIAREHGGSLRLETSREGETTTFRLALPLAGGGPLVRRCRILVAEDDPVLGELMRRTLAGVGFYEVELVRDGASALKSCRRGPPDLLIADLLMDGGDGFELVSGLREDPALSETAVLVVTALDGPSLADRLADLKVWEVLHKPFKVADLLDRVQRLCPCERRE